jgi:cell division protein FtsB
MHSPVSPWLWRVVVAAVIAGALGYIPYRVYGSNGYVHYRKLTQTLDHLERKNEGLRHENASLWRDITALRHDLQAIMAVARDDLGMVLPGEVVLQIDRSFVAGHELAP